MRLAWHCGKFDSAALKVISIRGGSKSIEGALEVIFEVRKGLCGVPYDVLGYIRKKGAGVRRKCWSRREGTLSRVKSARERVKWGGLSLVRIQFLV